MQGHAGNWGHRGDLRKPPEKKEEARYLERLHSDGYNGEREGCLEEASTPPAVRKESGEASQRR